MPRMHNPASARDALLLNIAQLQFRIETLETRNWDRLDFHDVAVWALRAALEEAFEAGRRAFGQKGFDLAHGKRNHTG